MTPVTMQDYQLYENVLTTTKTINEQKQTLAQQNDKNAAIALKELHPVVKVKTLHYGSTTRSKIDGDWPALILIFSDCCRFPYEQCSLHTRTENKLLVSSLKHLTRSVRT